MTRRERRTSAGDAPIQLGASLDAVTGELGAAPASALEAVTRHLFATLGDTWRGRVDVVSLVDAELTIVAVDGRAASELRYRSAELTAAFETPSGEARVARIRVRVRRR